MSQSFKFTSRISLPSRGVKSLVLTLSNVPEGFRGWVMRVECMVASSAVFRNDAQSSDSLDRLLSPKSDNF